MTHTTSYTPSNISSILTHIPITTATAVGRKRSEVNYCVATGGPITSPAHLFVRPSVLAQKVKSQGHRTSETSRKWRIFHMNVFLQEIWANAHETSESL